MPTAPPSHADPALVSQVEGDYRTVERYRMAVRARLAGPIVRVRAGKNWKGQPGYGWECLVCEPTRRARGLHLFNRWTDWVRRRRPDPHPWERAMRAAQWHVHEHHPERRTCGLFHIEGV